MEIYEFYNQSLKVFSTTFFISFIHTSHWKSLEPYTN